MRKVFAPPTSAAIFLTRMGCCSTAPIYCAGALRQTTEDDDVRIARTVTWRAAFFVGAAQALALDPGFSRSGATMGGGLSVGLSNKDAARFAFLLATPIIGAAACSSCPSSSGTHRRRCRGQAFVAALCSAVTAYLAVRFLMRFFETNTLTPFAIYCFAAGLACTMYFVT